MLGPGHQLQRQEVLEPRVSAQGWILAHSALLAPVLLLGSDVLARVVLGERTELPVGLMTALIGAPVFIALVRRRKVAKL
ncbi:iron chelate uptake ABC transporter family permease subunit [Saccharopolyspora sp. NPDC050389]|uniref:iron chelate uptake ABC transporter family permease subunit n=1 Tax=Saccharopolyspora sp. NPDC050389 TaxID=3155516 RepID=UPI0033D2D419